MALGVVTRELSNEETSLAMVGRAFISSRENNGCDIIRLL